VRETFTQVDWCTPAKARYVRVVEYEVPDRAGDGKDELIALVTTILDLR
jgi:hypothetical protein